jgi:transcriptional regulator with XRE-family HTH domain
MKADSERGVTGAWAYNARQEADLSVEEVVVALGKAGQAVSPATIRGIESGSKKPGARLLRKLGDVLGSEPPGHGVAADAPDLATALQALTQELAAMRLERESMGERVESLERAVRALGGSPEPQPEAEASPTPRAPRASTGSGR